MKARGRSLGGDTVGKYRGLLVCVWTPSGALGIVCGQRGVGVPVAVVCFICLTNVNLGLLDLRDVFLKISDFRYVKQINRRGLLELSRAHWQKIFWSMAFVRCLFSFSFTSSMSPKKCFNTSDSSEDLKILSKDWRLIQGTSRGGRYLYVTCHLCFNSTSSLESQNWHN